MVVFNSEQKTSVILEEEDSDLNGPVVRLVQNQDWFRTGSRPGLRSSRCVLTRSVSLQVDRRCSRCGKEGMVFHTRQMRSADEGQTVFFTCLHCR